MKGRLASFLGWPVRKGERAGNVVALHHLLDREGRHGGDAAVGVVPFHVTGRISDEWFARELTGCLRAAG